MPLGRLAPNGPAIARTVQKLSIVIWFQLGVTQNVYVPPLAHHLLSEAIGSVRQRAVRAKKHQIDWVRGPAQYHQQDISFDAKNGVLTLKGEVKTPQQRQQAQQVAANIPEVAQVVNEIEVKR